MVQPPFLGPSDFGVAPQGRSRPVHTEKTKDTGYPKTTRASELLRIARSRFHKGGPVGIRIRSHFDVSLDGRLGNSTPARKLTILAQWAL